MLLIYLFHIPVYIHVNGTKIPHLLSLSINFLKYISLLKAHGKIKIITKFERSSFNSYSSLKIRDLDIL